MADDKTPPQITTGSFVSWSGGKGRVDLVVTKGTVPGVSGDPVEATEDSPAARVVVWKDGKATREKIAASTHTLKRIAPLDGEEKSDPTAALVALHGQHEAHREDAALDESASLTGIAVKSAYDRGLVSWPGPHATSLGPVDWALGRAAHLCKAARGEVEVTNDADLLHPAHPLAVKSPDAPVVIDAGEVAREMDAILAASTEE